VNSKTAIMSDIDPAKLKVVELRAELTARGLDSKGNKPVLVDRLTEALEKEKKGGELCLLFPRYFFIWISISKYQKSYYSIAFI
jgi:hypothetical protein